MKELILLLEKLGIQLLETAEPELIADAKAEALIFCKQRLAFRTEQLKELKVVQHMATFGHGLLKDDAQIVFVEGCIACLNAAIALIESHTTEQPAA
jgi:hypothetical protein